MRKKMYGILSGILTAAMLWNCWKISSLDLTNFDTAKVKDMSSLFYSCLNLEEILVGTKWRLERCATENMFCRCGTDYVTLAE